jgi:hypothetical protein
MGSPEQKLKGGPLKAQFTYRNVTTPFEVSDPPPEECDWKVPPHRKERVPAMKMRLRLKAVKDHVAVYRVAKVTAGNVAVKDPK